MFRKLFAFLAAYLTFRLIEFVIGAALIALMLLIIAGACVVVWAINHWLGTPWVYILAVPVSLLTLWPVARVYAKLAPHGPA